MMTYRLHIGDRCWRSDLPVKWGYRQYTWVLHGAEVECMTRALDLPTIPYAVIAGNGELWVSYEDDFNQAQALYEFVGHQLGIQ